MIASQTLAVEVVRLLDDAFAKLDEAMQLVRRRASIEDQAEFRKGAVPLAEGIVVDLLDQIYRKHPDLAPANWFEADDKLRYRVLKQERERMRQPS